MAARGRGRNRGYALAADTMSQAAEIATIVAGILGGPSCAVYIVPDGLTMGHKVNMAQVVTDAVKIHALIKCKCSMDAYVVDEKLGGSE